MLLTMLIFWVCTLSLSYIPARRQLAHCKLAVIFAVCRIERAECKPSLIKLVIHPECPGGKQSAALVVTGRIDPLGLRVSIASFAAKNRVNHPGIPEVVELICLAPDISVINPYVERILVILRDGKEKCLREVIIT